MSSPALLAPFRALANQLLDSPLARCVWQPNAIVANDAFSQLFPQGPPLNALTAIRKAHERGEPSQARIGEFLWTLTPLETMGERAVFVFVAQPEKSSAALNALPAIVRAANSREAQLPDVQAFMQLLLDVQPTLITTCLLFRSRSENSFVFVRETGEAMIEARNWLRWPFDRLFSRRRACVVKHPVSGVRALAVPFTMTNGERYVVVGLLRNSPDLSHDEALLIRTIEALTLPSTESPGVARQYALDRVSAAPTAMAPEFVLFAVDDRLSREVQELIARRGWNLTVVNGLGELWEVLEARRTDVVLVDGYAVSEPLPLLRAIRHASQNSHVAIVYIGGEADDGELDLLIEGRIAEGASRDEMFRALKETIRAIPKRRRQWLASAGGRFWEQLVQSRDCTHLAGVVCESAHEIGADRCVVQMFDSAGILYSAHWPKSEPPAIEVVPTTFLDGYAVMRSQIDDEFFIEVTDDPDARSRLRQLMPQSGASIPIMESGRVIGTMLVLTLARQLTDIEFEAFVSLAESASRAFSVLQLRLSRSEPRAFSESPPWTQMVVRDCHIDSYRGPTALPCFRMSPFGRGSQCFGIVAAEGHEPRESIAIADAILREMSFVAERSDEFDVDLLHAAIAAAAHNLRGAFAGIVSTEESRLSFAARRFPAPLQIGEHGPAPLPQKRTDSHGGRISLRPRTLTIIYGNEAQPQLSAAELVAVVQKQLELSSINPLAAVIGAVSQPSALALAAISRRSFGAVK